MAEQPTERRSGGHRGAPGNAAAVIAVLVFLGLTLLGGFAYLHFLGADEYDPPAALNLGFVTAPIEEAMQPDAVAQVQREIFDRGSRMTGQRGYVDTAEQIRKAFDDAGLTVFEQAFTTHSPLSRERSIHRVVQGRAEPLEGVAVFPLLPNVIQPVVTPPEGLAGELVRITPEVLRTRSSFTGAIGLVDASAGNFDPDFGFAWDRYASLGLSGLVISHPDGLSAVPWTAVYPSDRKNGITANMPVNFVRVAATPGIFRYVGETVRLDVRGELAAVEGRNLFGLLRAENPTRELMIISAPYDALAVLPDRAPDGLQALRVATFLQLVEGLSRYRDSLRRDILFFAVGNSFLAGQGHYELLKLLDLITTARAKETRTPEGPTGEPRIWNRRVARLEERRSRHEPRLMRVRRILDAIAEGPFLADAAYTVSAMDALDRSTASFLREELRHVLNVEVLERQEPMLEAAIRLERIEQVTADTPELRAFLEKKIRFDKATAAAGSGLERLLENHREIIRAESMASRFAGRIRYLEAFHERELARLKEETELVDLLNGYNDFAFFEATLAPAKEGAPPEEVLTMNYRGNALDPVPASIYNALVTSSQVRGDDPAPTVPPLAKNQERVVDPQIRPYPISHQESYRMLGYGHFHFYNLRRRESFLEFASPEVPDFLTDLTSIEGSLTALGRTLLSIAHGNGSLAPVKNRMWLVFDHSGRVLVSNVGRSIVPDFRLENAFVFNKSGKTNRSWAAMGRYDLFFTTTDPYGEYAVPNLCVDFMDWPTYYSKGQRFSPVAAAFGDDGLIRFMKDEGPDGQRLFKSMDLNARRNSENVTIVTFRSDPVTLLDLTNPQSMKEYSGIDLVTASGMAPFRKQATFEDGGAHSFFLEPDQRFVALLKAGTPDNEMVQKTRAFALNPGAVADPESVTDFSRGYLVADSPRLAFIPEETAGSMTQVNAFRLDLQNRYRMADEQTNAYHERAVDLLAETEGEETGAYRDRRERARNSATYAMLNYPVLKESIFEAVVGILWFLGLLVPFVYFTEKLLFNFNDIRYQLTAQVIIFLLAFTALRILHPAFAMIRSSLMILLGFVIILIAGGMSVLFSGKFKENFEDLRKRQGRVAGATANTLGIVATAFLLGLNNMNRRKLRTGLTCATLVLLTFVMISFTSVRNLLQNEAVAVGKAPYQGILVKRDQFFPIQPSERVAFRSKYGEDYAVVERRAWIGGFNPGSGERLNATVEAGLAGHDRLTRSYTLKTILKMDPGEPLRDGLDYVAGPGWFTNADLVNGGPPPVLIGESAAAALGLSFAEVDSGGVVIRLGATPFRVHAIFADDSLDRLRDLDGSPLLPFDAELLESVVRASGGSGAGLLAPDESIRIASRYAAIIPAREYPLRPQEPGTERILSLAVSMPEASYGEASEVVRDYLVRTGEPAHYGLEGVAYRGTIRRAMTRSGLVDLLIPLLIAGLTVLNTMRGSVYERRGEIMVYNAVGIAPRYIFFMFFAEALVYSVMGCLLGYLLSQGVGRVLTEVGLTGGLNMTYTSLNTIWASLTIVGAVLFSTWFPAKNAMRIAAPADDAGWDLPEPQGDRIRFDLPFTFRDTGRVAVLEFVFRYLREHGEGSAGRFFAGQPQFGVADPLPEVRSDEGDLDPHLEATIWLKPFDLGVSQRLRISLPYDEDTGKYRARVELQRLSGTRESWTLLNRAFIREVRKHFLHWRAVTAEDKIELFREAAGKIRGSVSAGTVSPSAATPTA